MKELTLFALLFTFLNASVTNIDGLSGISAKSAKTTAEAKTVVNKKDFPATRERGITNTSQSPFAKLQSTALDATVWDSKGFWGERFDVCKDTMLLQLWKIFDDPQLSHAFRNFEIAAGLEKGVHKDPPFYDGDMYKWFEGCCAVYAITKDPQLKALMDKFVKTVVACQREDGYLHTKTLIKDLNEGNKQAKLAERLQFETYNFGHLMTAACLHYRATGEKTLLNVAVKATDYLYRYYQRSPEELAQNAICPSHYMGVAEMYRTTRDPKYLELAKGLIDIRRFVKNGTDDNQDRIPFRQQKKAMGHAVRANYLYAGAADVCLETGEDSLMQCLNAIWDDVVHTKMYITGGCGALYDGTSPDGTNYTPDSIQKTHQSYGRSYQLPNHTAHNETCANIGNMIWNWRMFELSADPKYVDILEQTLYNSILPGISLDGKKYFYTNPLAISDSFPYTMRWTIGEYKKRESYISCFCCPPNTVRTLAETQLYAYSLSEKGVWVNLYGENRLNTTLMDGSSIQLKQTSDYPWDGHVRLEIVQAPKNACSFLLRIPGWCSDAKLYINQVQQDVDCSPERYVEIRRKWNNGETIELDLSMPVRLVEANPLVEEARNQVAVMRGPLLYCLESTDLPAGVRLQDVILPISAKLLPVKGQEAGLSITLFDPIAGSPVLMLEGTALVQKRASWSHTLYREVSTETKPINIRLVPYYAWGNRGRSEMSVWLPFTR
jgi:uncharacterized protein